MPRRQQKDRPTIRPIPAELLANVGPDRRYDADTDPNLPENFRPITIGIGVSGLFKFMKSLQDAAKEAGFKSHLLRPAVEFVPSALATPVFRARIAAEKKQQDYRTWLPDPTEVIGSKIVNHIENGLRGSINGTRVDVLLSHRRTVGEGASRLIVVSAILDGSSATGQLLGKASELAYQQLGLVQEPTDTTEVSVPVLEVNSSYSETRSWFQACCDSALPRHVTLDTMGMIE